MSIMDEAKRLGSAGEPEKGIALIESAARAGHAEALFIIANWRLWGIHGPRDLRAVHNLLEQAECAGWTEAATLRAHLIGNGTGCASDPDSARAIVEVLASANADAAAQIALLDRMAPLSALRSEVLSVDPETRIVRTFLSEAECDYLAGKADPLLRPSMVLDPRTGRPRPHPIRTSSSMNFDPANEDLVVHAINRRIADVTATRVDCGEPLHVLRYMPGQEYRPHLDSLPNTTNQRLWTALIYLNDDYDGGETTFPGINLTVRGNKGDCLIFRVSSDDGKGDRRLVHAGLPVTRGVKWLASRWIRRWPHEAEVLRS